MTTALKFLSQIAALSASGDGRELNDELGVDHGFQHDTGDSLDALDQIIHGARKLLGQPHDERAMVFVDSNAEIISGPIPDAVDLKSALQWLLDDMHGAGETHGDTGIPFDSVECAARALVNRGGFLSWYDPLTRLPIVDGGAKEWLHRYAGTAEEAMQTAREFMSKVADAERGTATLADGTVLMDAFIVSPGAGSGLAP